MANLYTVVYNSSGPQPHLKVTVTATTQPNAIAAVKTADKTYKDVVTVTEHATGIIVGS